MRESTGLPFSIRRLTIAVALLYAAVAMGVGITFTTSTLPAYACILLCFTFVGAAFGVLLKRTIEGAFLGAILFLACLIYMVIWGTFRGG